MKERAADRRDPGAVVRVEGGRSLALKLVALLGTVLAVTSAILIVANYRMARNDYEHRQADRAKASAKSIAESVGAETAPESRKRRAGALLKYAVEVDSAWQAVWAETDGKAVAEERGASFHEPLGNGGEQVDETADIPQTAGAEGVPSAPPPGLIRIRVDLRPGLASLSSDLRFQILITFLGLLGSVAGVYFGADRLVLSPISRLHAAMVRMAAGGPYDPVEPRGRDEIAELIGQVNRLVGLLINREAENRAAAATLTLVREAVPDVIYRYDFARNQFEFLSDSVAAQTGFSREEILRNPLLLLEEMVHPEDLPRIRAQMAVHVRKGGTPGGVVLEFRRRKKDGSVRWIEDHVTPEPDGDGKMARQSGVMRDTTSQKQADQALRRSEALNRAVAETALDAMVTADESGTILSANAAVERIFGHAPSDLTGKSLEMLMPERLRPAHAAGLARVAATGVARIVGRPMHLFALTRDGREIPVEIAIGIAHSPTGRVFTGIVRDLTQQRAVEAQLLHAQKMEAVGTLAGGIAHDFNNILSVVVGHAEMARGRLDAGHRVQKSLEAIVAASQRAAELTSRLLGFARSAPRLARPIDVAQVVRGALDLLARALDKAIEIRTEIPPDLPAVVADGSQMEHALMNLCINARDAMPSGGRLTISAALVDVLPSRPSLPSDASPGVYVRLSVADTGTGIAPEVKARLFEPFFTTKERGRGTGLGLAMVYGVVRGHGGFVEVDSAPGRGSRFDLFFPATTEPAERPPDAPHPAVAGGRETLLVIDDDEQVRTLIAGMLESFGYRVLAAPDGPSGLDLLSSTPDIALVVLDMILPGIGGKEVFRRIRAMRPGMKVLLSTGYSEQGDAQEILAAGCDGILRKPYLPEALARSVRTILDKTPAPPA